MNGRQQRHQQRICDLPPPSFPHLLVALILRFDVATQRLPRGAFNCWMDAPPAVVLLSREVDWVIVSPCVAFGTFAASGPLVGLQAVRNIILFHSLGSKLESNAVWMRIGFGPGVLLGCNPPFSYDSKLVSPNSWLTNGCRNTT